MAGRGAGEEAPALARQVLLDLVLARGKELEGVRPHRRIRDRGVHGDRREPAGGQRLLHARGRQRIDERARVTHEQPSLARRRRWRDTATHRSREDHRRVLAPATSLPEDARLVDLGEIDIRRRSAAREFRSLRIDHRRDVPDAVGDRHRPHPAVFVRFDQRVRVVGHRPAAFAPPLADERNRSRPLVELTQARCAARSRRSGRCSRERNPPDQDSIELGDRGSFDVNAGRDRAAEQHLGEPLDIELPAARAFGERLDARVALHPTTPCCRSSG